MTFTVRVLGSDILFPCEAGESVLDAAERAGYSIPYSCRKGVCSTCEGALNDGVAEVGLKQARAPCNDVLLCRAKPRSDLAITPKRIEKRAALARRRLKASVYRLDRPTGDVAILKLRFPAGTRVKFRAGQYLRVIMTDGESRNFSMANPPHENDGVELHIRHVAGGRFSEDVLASLGTGDRLDIELPYGEFFLREDAGMPIIFVATGTGLAPIRSMIEDMIKRGITRPARLYWGARGRQDLYLADLSEKWIPRAPWLSFTAVLSEPDTGWQGRRGLVHRAVMEDCPDLSGHQVYACGNPFMITAATNDFSRIGKLPADQFFADPFVPSGEHEANG